MHGFAMDSRIRGIDLVKSYLNETYHACLSSIHDVMKGSTRVEHKMQIIQPLALNK